MALFSNRTPRQFNFLPRFHKPEDDKKIRFRRITLYDPRGRNSAPWFYLALLIVVVLLIVIIGGIRKPAVAPVLSAEDAVVVLTKVLDD